MLEPHVQFGAMTESAQSWTDLRYDVTDHVATITLDRPDARNAYSEHMVDSLVQALKFADRDPEIRAIVLTGAGRAFCAGGDLKRMRDRTGMFAGDPISLRRAYARGIQEIPKAVSYTHLTLPTTPYV